MQTAADVVNRGTRLDAVWSLVAHLHLAVYGVGPTTLLAGSDRPTSDGLYLYGAEITLLTVMAGTASEPLSRFAQRIATAEGSAAADVTHALAGATKNLFVAAYLQARKLDLSADPQVTPFDEWVVYFAAFDPRMGVVAARHVAAGAGSTLTLSASRLDAAPRPTKQAFVDAIHRAILYADLRVEMSPTPISLNMGANGPGDAANVTAAVSWQIVKTYNFGWLATHGCGFRHPPGPLQTDVYLSFPEGSDPYFGVSPSTEVEPTKFGVASFRVVAAEDPGHGKGSERVVERTVVGDIFPVGGGSTDSPALLDCPHGVSGSTHVNLWLMGQNSVLLLIHFHGVPRFVVTVTSKLTDTSGSPTRGTHQFNLQVNADSVGSVDPNGTNNWVQGSGTPTYSFATQGVCDGPGGGRMKAASKPGSAWSAEVYFEQDAAGNITNPRLILAPPPAFNQGPSVSLSCPNGQRLPTLPLFSAYFSGGFTGPACNPGMIPAAGRYFCHFASLVTGISHQDV